MLLLLTLPSIIARPASAIQEQALSHQINAALDHLLQQVGKDVKPTFEPGKTSAILDFIETDKDRNTLYYPHEISDTTSAYYQFEIDSSMDRLLGYAYNDDIPPQVFSPSSLRTTYRLEPGGGESDCWQWRLPADDTPQIVRFAEHEEVTPDLFTGAYYDYDADRTLILFRHKGRNVFISLSRQRDVSDVGKKGAALGEEGNWDYLYSGETGLNKTGLGWVKSYMYKSFSVTVFYESNSPRPRLLCGTFKWLNAGWAGINMVKRRHILSGLHRYVRDFRGIIENKKLPHHNEMADGFTTLKNLSSEELRPYLADYLKSLASQYATTRTLSRGLFRNLLAPEKYLRLLDLPEMRAILELEYLKALLGKQCKLRGLPTLSHPLSVSSR